MYLRHLHEHLCDTRAANAQQGRRVVQQQGRRPEGKRQDTHQRAMVSEHTGGTGSTMRIVVIDEMVRKYTKASHLRQMHYGECQTRSHTHTHTHICVYTHMYAPANTPALQIHTYAHTHTHTYIHTYTCVHIQTHVRTCECALRGGRRLRSGQCVSARPCRPSSAAQAPAPAPGLWFVVCGLGSRV
jgi:hypothetical protein